jgi:hypothetical protein
MDNGGYIGKELITINRLRPIFLLNYKVNSTNYTCLSNYNYTYASDIFRNVVNAAEFDYRDIQNYTLQVQSYLHGYSANIYPTVTAVNTSMPFYLCAWG